MLRRIAFNLELKLSKKHISYHPTFLWETFKNYQENWNYSNISNQQICLEIIIRSISIWQTFTNWTVEVVYDWWIIGMGIWRGNGLRRDSENNFCELTWKISNVEQYSLKIKYHDLVIENIGKYIPALDPPNLQRRKIEIRNIWEQ